MTFFKTERTRMTDDWARTMLPEHLKPTGFQLEAAEKGLNLAPLIRTEARDYFAKNGITWHRHANHALSSQVCCLNFLMPLSRRPDMLSRLVGRALGIAPPRMIALDGETFVDFEWPGRKDYLNEANGRAPQRGANTTNADAIVRFEGAAGPEALLIEWKYTERYAPATSKWSERNHVRLGRYADLIFADNGPIRRDCGFEAEDFLHEPVYQLLRQQMLAWQMQKHGEDGATRVRVLHVSPQANRPLHRMTAPNLPQGDVFEVFRGLLVDPDAFVARSTESLFGPMLAETPEDEATAEWLGYLRNRYPFVVSPLTQPTKTD